jgi:hypothetical protein
MPTNQAADIFYDALGGSGRIRSRVLLP